MTLRTCSVSMRDLKGVEHGLRIFRKNEWVDDVGTGLTEVHVVVKHRHTVLMKDFERWLNGGRGSPCEFTLKNRVRKILQE